MRTLEDIKAIINAERPKIEARYPLRLLSIFGSYARGEQTEDSDVDVLAERIGDELSLLDVMAAQRLLAWKLDSKVDLVLTTELHPMMKEPILTQAKVL
jgi:uncharacterized protein